MPYILRVDEVLQHAWDALPPSASAELTNAMINVCEDPLGATTPYGEDDGVMRTLALQSVMAVLMITHATRHVRILQITHIG
ncbi:hypothetical protein [Kitasatospora sp. NPDC001175]|uniref:hypothetical protein n=1 Tax=Kitasatospora sp. NPDC001175 TaxID=3157103 RepID=UPI003D020403